MAVIAFVSLASTATVPTPELVDGSATEDFRPLESIAEPTDSYRVPLNIQLPKIEINPVPFYAPEPITYLKPPSENQEPNYYQVPIPAQELVAPVEAEWYPNDPTLYYEVPALVTKQELPTNSYPKKYNEEIHSKSKPYSSKPKQEILLEAIDEREYETKQKDLQKSFQQLAKKENLKQIEAEKVINRTEPTVPEKKVNEPLISGSEIESESEGESKESEGYEKGLDGKLTASLGIPSSSHDDSSDGDGDRINFHMVGHDGPHSYKWGFDTGKG